MYATASPPPTFKGVHQYVYLLPYIYINIIDMISVMAPRYPCFRDRYQCDIMCAKPPSSPCSPKVYIHIYIYVY